MKKSLLLCTGLAFVACISHAATLTTGSPNDNNYAGAKLTPAFGTYINFDNLNPFSQVASDAYSPLGVQSMSSNDATDPLVVIPYSAQSSPNYLSTTSGTGGLTITLSKMVNIIGIGLLQSDGVSDTLQALDGMGNILGSYTVTVPLDGNTPFNNYYVINDSSEDIKSLIISSSGSFAVDDLQFAPEPLNVILVPVGLILFGLASRKLRSMSARLTDK